MEEIEGFFRDGVPARQWRNQPWKSAMLETKIDEESDISEKAHGVEQEDQLPPGYAWLDSESAIGVSQGPVSSQALDRVS
jgi:hypothetical protein